MRSVDTNIILRFLVRDDVEQEARADAILQQNFFVTLSVLVETEWVLRSSYRWSRQMIHQGLSGLWALPALIEIDPRVPWAFDRYAQGADLADMLHLIASTPADSFATFDRRLAAQAGPDSPVAIETLDA